MQTQKSFEVSETGMLYLIPTPIGNLEDMTFRAVRLLKEADLIAAEDTRNTQKILNHFEIETSQISFHEHNSKERTKQLVERMLAGETVAQVSDAGMPSISDPGVDLVKAAVDAGIAVVPLPGANAALTALIASGLAPQPFYFYGFLSRKKKTLQSELDLLKNRQETMIFYESPHRLKEMLEQMETVFGSERKIVLARELTKRYEEFIRGSISDVLKWAQNEQIRGEFCVIVEGNQNPELNEQEAEWVKWTLKEHVEKVLNMQGGTSKQAIKEVAQLRNIQKREVYSAYHEL
ncbi:16S rRNA (cytidine(1402)-2'-O)-methyltransferase [Marinilactibacillus psychrotolerans]|uniref:Ribosomal RNA small subunit methyltransferase I n=1 Tax=Marinilactibacillus psychrotolerans TaxID=191770 RepID=A0A5R9C108_9LACT|nr:16S rRNA (cytidine(1402)-2'-O)-methyltransferase [Marinilactibacillus psychrotolerans]TLQ06359.1 16S rRNA (cytidine(1402)-2'-O)-methyltransferase [Marinilactibacillus psychrotolerans]